MIDNMIDNDLIVANDDVLQIIIGHIILGLGINGILTMKL